MSLVKVSVRSLFQTGYGQHKFQKFYPLAFATVIISPPQSAEAMPKQRRTPFPAKPHRAIAAIALPAILANSSAPLVGLVDTWAIGHLPGAVYLAAIGLGSVIFNFILWAFGFLRMGTTGVVAQARGQGDPAPLIALVWRSMALALGLGLLLLAFRNPLLKVALQALDPPSPVAALTSGYYDVRIWSTPASLLNYTVAGVLFGLARARAVLVQQLVLNITNAVLSVVFVVALGMGVKGVALGTLIAQWLATAVGIWLLLSVFSLSSLLNGLKDTQVWLFSAFKHLIALNGFIFVRTILLMLAFSLIMRVAGQLGEIEMAASHVVLQYLMLISLGLDGFAHAAEALAGSAWGNDNVGDFRRWVRLTGVWALLASMVYSVGFGLAGEAITAVLTNIGAVRDAVATIMPIVTVLPLVAVACYQFDGVYIGATAAPAMLGTMAIAFAVYLLVLQPLTLAYGFAGLWAAVLIFMATRGLSQAIWYPRLLSRLR